MGKMIRCFLMIVLCCVAAQSVANANEADMVWRGLDDSRMRIVSGQCVVRGTTAKNGDTREENCLIVFDSQKGFYRFDRIGVANSLLTPEYYYECWEPGTDRSAIERQPHTTRETSHKIDLFDIRMLGFFTLISVYNDLRYDKDTITRFLENKKLVEFQRYNNGVVAITYIVTPKLIQLSDDEKTRQTYWIDPSTGFSLIKAEYRHSGGDVDTTEITWKEKNNVWVPDTCQFLSNQGFSGVWKFDWMLVNEVIPTHFFEVSNLSETPVKVFSWELGEAVEIGTAGQGEEYFYETQDRHFHPFNVILMVIGIFLIVLGLGKKIYDYVKSRSRK